MRKCWNWQTGQTKDLVVIAIVWVQVPSSALEKKTDMQVVLHIRFLFGAESDLNPGFKVSAPLRSVQSRCPQDILHPIFRKEREVGPF